MFIFPAICCNVFHVALRCKTARILFPWKYTLKKNPSFNASWNKSEKDQIYLLHLSVEFKKQNKQTKKKPKIYRNDGEGKRMMLFFVLQMFYVLKYGHAKSIITLGPGKLEFDVK